MTFDEFKATGKDVKNLAEAIPEMAYMFDGETPPAGRVYLDGGLYIEKTARGWMLTIGNDSQECAGYTGFEKALFDFAVSEGYVENEGGYVENEGGLE